MNNLKSIDINLPQYLRTMNRYKNSNRIRIILILIFIFSCLPAVFFYMFLRDLSILSSSFNAYISSGSSIFFPSLPTINILFFLPKEFQIMNFTVGHLIDITIIVDIILHAESLVYQYVKIYILSYREFEMYCDLGYHPELFDLDLSNFEQESMNELKYIGPNGLYFSQPLNYFKERDILRIQYLEEISKFPIRFKRNGDFYGVKTIKTSKDSSKKSRNYYTFSHKHSIFKFLGNTRIFFFFYYKITNNHIHSIKTCSEKRNEMTFCSDKLFLPFFIHVKN